MTGFSTGLFLGLPHNYLRMIVVFIQDYHLQGKSADTQADPEGLPKYTAALQNPIVSLISTLTEPCDSP